MPTPTPRPVSLTAFGAAMLRVAHQLFDDEPKIVDDPILPRLFEAEAIARLRADPQRLRAARIVALRVHLLVRQRFAEDRLAEAYRRGVRQYVILGAGLDTFAYRQPAWARDLRIFEVDHPESQQAKRARLEAAGIAPPPNLAYVTLDLELDAVRDSLAAGGFDPRQPAFVACLGVLVYLSEAANDKVLEFAASLPASSEIVLTFTAPREARADGEDEDHRGPTLAERAAAVGEPFRTWMTGEALTARLRQLQFAEISVLEPDDTFDRYLRDRRDGLRPPRHASIASARV
jgi:methyltransferase (TIGR00027 family)